MAAAYSLSGEESNFWKALWYLEASFSVQRKTAESAHNQYHKVNCKEEASFKAETNPYMAFGTNSMYDEDDDDDSPF